MMSLHDRPRKILLAAGAALLALAVAVPWTMSRVSSRGDDTQELLRRAVEDDRAAAVSLVPSKTIPVPVTTSTGEALRAQVTAIESRTGKTVGFAPRLDRPLKDGESATLKMPGGGQVVISATPIGAAPPSNVTPPRSRP